MIKAGGCHNLLLPALTGLTRLPGLWIFSTLLPVCFLEAEKLLSHAMKHKGAFEEHYTALRFFCQWFSVRKWCCRSKSNLVLFLLLHICRHQTQAVRATNSLLYKSESQKHSSYGTTGCCKDLPAWAPFSEQCFPLLQNQGTLKLLYGSHWVRPSSQS